MTPVSLSTLLERADEETLRKIVGHSALSLLNLLDPTLTRPSVLRKIVLDSEDTFRLLRDAQTRKELFFLMRAEEAEWLLDKWVAQDGSQTARSPYSTLAEVELRAGSKMERELFDLLGVANRADSASTEAQSVENSSGVDASYGLFPHQRDAVARVVSQIEAEPHRVLLHMPTGAGKTRVAMNVIADHLRRQEPGLVIWLAYSEELCQQAASEFEQSWSQLGNRQVELSRLWGPFDSDVDEISDGILIAGLAKTYNIARKNVRRISSLADKVTLVVIDEAHVATAETYALTLEVLATKRPKTGLVGLTATPGRSWADIDADEELSNFFGRRKVTLRVEGYPNPVDYLIDHGYLSRARFRSLLHGGGYLLNQADLASVQRYLDIPLQVLKKIAEDEQRNLVIVTEIEKLAREHARILLFAATVEHARLLAAVLRARGFDASAVTAETPRLERSRIIARFQSTGDSPQVLCNYGVLTAGFDAPKIDAAVIARPTKSLVLYSQMVGRAIRGPRMGGTADCEVVTVVDQGLPGFGSVAESFLNWEDVWKEE